MREHDNFEDQYIDFFIGEVAAWTGIADELVNML